MKKVIVFGGGTGLSCLLSGLKQFPIDVTTVITVSDNGSSTGILKKELDIPAVGDVGKVLISMANVDEDFVQLLRYRFSKDGSLYTYMSKLLNIKGTVLPLTEEKVELVGKNGRQEYFGQVAVSHNAGKIRKLDYDHSIHISEAVIEKIGEADLIIFSSGSLYTSILPHLLAPAVRKALENAKAPILYVCNIVTQPGETDGYSVSDHLKTLNRYLQRRTVDIVLANNAVPDPETAERYLKTEGKEPVSIDRSVLKWMNVRLIEDNLLSIENGSIRHNALKTAFLIFSLLMEQE